MDRSSIEDWSEDYSLHRPKCNHRYDNPANNPYKTQTTNMTKMKELLFLEQKLQVKDCNLHVHTYTTSI